MEKSNDEVTVKNPKMDEIKKDPYNFVCNYAESLYPHVGRKAFEILSLAPCSLIMPDIPFGSKTIRSNLHTILLTSSGGGKSSLSDLFSKFALNPLKLESVTSAGLEGSIMNSGNTFTLIVGDFATMSRDPILMKVLEGILGEEKTIKRRTARKEIDMDVNATALLCGVSSDLSRYIMTGMLWRLCPIMCSYSPEEHRDVGMHLMLNAGKVQDDGREAIITEYYQNLLKFQASDKRIVGYDVPERFKRGLHKEWTKITEPYVNELGLNFFRELMDGLRFMLSHAFLNMYRREIIDGHLVPNEEDYIIAVRLMKQSIRFKFRLIRSEGFAKGLKDVRDFKRIMQSEKVPEQVKDMIRALVEVKGDKINLR